MRDFFNYDHHPEVLRERFPKHLWPQSEDPKGRDEALTFIKFADAACLSLDAAPRCLLGEKMPDLECSIGGQRTLFELAEIVDEDLARAYSTQTAGSSSYPAHAALERILRQKLSKQYAVNDRLPVHLLLYYDLHRPWGPFDFLLQWGAELARLVEGSQFKRIWIFDRRVDSVLGWFERTPAGLSLTRFDLSARPLR